MTKINNVLAGLKKPRGLNRFDAERIGDHVLNTTVAALRTQGHVIAGQWEKVPTRFGTTARVLRYRWLRGPSKANPFAEPLARK